MACNQNTHHFRGFKFSCAPLHFVINNKLQGVTGLGTSHFHTYKPRFIPEGHRDLRYFSKVTFYQIDLAMRNTKDVKGEPIARTVRDVHLRCDCHALVDFYEIH
jgi:hypothetical protein